MREDQWMNLLISLVQLIRSRDVGWGLRITGFPKNCPCLFHVSLNIVVLL